MIKIQNFKNNFLQIILWFFIIGFIFLFSYLSIKRYKTLNSYYYDLGIMNQVVYNTSRGRFLQMTNQDLKKNVSRLAIHFDPILAVFAPFYWFYPGPEVLLIGQVIIVALGAWAVFLISQKIFEKRRDSRFRGNDIKKFGNEIKNFRNNIENFGNDIKKFWIDIKDFVNKIKGFNYANDIKESKNNKREYLKDEENKNNLKNNNSLISLIFSILYLFYFAIQRVVLFDFHAVSLATTFLLFALYFVLIKNYYLYFIFIFLSLLTKEHLGLVIFLLGVYLFIFKKEKKVGLITSFLGISFFVLTVFFLIPYFRQGDHFALGYFSNIKARIKEIFFNGLDYSKMILTPSLYSLFSPFELLISLPEWIINIVSLNNNMRSYYFHYNSVIVSFLFYSLILGYKNFNEKVKNSFLKKLVFILFLFLNIYSIYKYNPLPSSFVKEPIRYKEINPITKKSIETWRQKLKDENIIVSTTPKLAPFFTNRITYHNFLYDSAFSEMGLVDDDIIKTIDDYQIADYVIIYRKEIDPFNKGTLSVKFYQRLISDKNYQMIYSDNLNERSIEVYKKIKN